MSDLKSAVTRLYTAHTPGAVRFRYALVIFDALTVLFFFLTVNTEYGVALTVLSRVAGAAILVELLMRFWVSEERWHLLTRIYTLADIVVIASLFLDLFVPGNLAFLWVLRGLRLIQSYHLLYDLRRGSDWFRKHEDTMVAGINLFVFVMLAAATTRAFFIDETVTETPYVDALYFTVATLSTTGYGDITLGTPLGKLFSVFVMVVGVTLFVRLAQAIFQPEKVNFTCQTCGLMRHDPDAIHCKHCGAIVHIKTRGA